MYNNVKYLFNISKAGDLFHLEDSYIVQDIPQVLNIIQGIITQVRYFADLCFQTFETNLDFDSQVHNRVLHN